MADNDDKNIDISSGAASDKPAAAEFVPTAATVTDDAEPVVIPAKPFMATAEPDPVAAPVAAAAASPRQSGNQPIHLVIGAVLLLLVVALGLQLVAAKKDNKNLQTQLASVQSNPQALVQKQSDDLVAKVGSLMKLPTGETPTVAAVSDAAAAKQQSPFFATAANGDKVLLYVKAGEAILYRPSTNKIILVAPLTFNNAQASATTKK